MKGVSQSAGGPQASSSAAPLPVAPDPSPQAALDDDSQPRGYFIGGCGHRTLLFGVGSYVGPCDDCESDDT